MSVLPKHEAVYDTYAQLSKIMGIDAGEKTSEANRVEPP